MSELNFQKLTPTQEADLSGYEEALEYIFSEDDIKNIAISGAYSSGKSSIIETYKKKHKDKKFIHLSLAHFQPMEVHSNDIVEEGSIRKTDKNIENIIEGKILNQLIQQIPSDKIPQTSFRIKRNLGESKPILTILIICGFLLISMHFLFFAAWKAFADSLNNVCVKLLFNWTSYPEVRLLSGLITIGVVGIAIYKLIQTQRKKNIFRKISVQGNEIEIFSDSNDSYFDKYLNEVLYLFENADVDGIVFEDIDRFGNTAIFERLREINTLTNVRLKDKNNTKDDKEAKRPLRFFYLLRDDIFNNKDRTKFFDYILPVIPVLDSSNSYNKLKEYLESAGIYELFDDHFLRGLSLYIDDLRILKNIFNEFLIYNSKLNKIELDVNRMFAIITYKNIFPKDFADLQLNRGFVYSLFQSKQKLIEDQTKSLQSKSDEITKKIQACEKERLKSIEELDYVNSARKDKADRNGYWNSPLRTEYQEWYRTDYLSRKQAIEDNATGEVSNLKKQASEILVRIQEIQRLSLAELLNREVIDSAFKVCFTNEIGEKEEFLEIKGSPYFDLLKYLISRGYIDESYFDYITYFYSNSLTQNDKVFLRSVADRQGKQFNYHLDLPRLVVENLNEFDFLQRETLNFDLTEYILKENPNNYASVMINQIKVDKRFDYIADYMRSEKLIAPMVKAINKDWPNMFYTALSTNAMNDDALKVYSYHTIENSDDEALKEVNVDGCLTNYISGKSTYLANEKINAEKACDSFVKLKVSFGEIDSETVNNRLFDLVYQNNLYDINKSNILLMLEKMYQVQDVQNLLKSFFTFIRKNQGSPLSDYLWSNPKDALSAYLSMYEGKIEDSSETIVEVVNNDKIDKADREKYIKRLATSVEDLSKVTDSSIQKMLLENKHVQYSVKNILYYFNQNNLNPVLINFINSEVSKLDYAENGDKNITEKFLNACIRCEKLDNEKYRQITENLCEPIEEFTIDDLSEEKLLILINQNLIPMNAKNLSFIRNNYKNVLFKFIDSYLDNYIQLAVDSSFSFDELTELLNWKKITDEQKIKLIEMTDEPISVSEGKFSDKLLVYILDYNYSIEDLPWLLQNYAKQTVEVQTVIWRRVVEEIENVIDNAEQICGDLLNKLLSSSEIEFDYKIQILEKLDLEKLNIDEICNLLLTIGAEKIADNLRGGNKHVDITETNEQILNLLFNLDLIHKFEVTPDNQHYKKIRFKEKNMK